MTTVTILADNGASSGTSGLKTSGGNDGTLVLQTTTAGGTATTAQTIGTDQVTTFAQAANLPNTFGFKNRIINGGMMIDQRNAGAAVTTSGAFPVDRFNIGNAGTTATFSMQQSSTAPSGFSNSVAFTVTASDATLDATDRTYLTQSIEGLNVADLGWGTASAATVTLSFWVRSSLTGTFGGSLRNSATNRSYPFSYTISSTNTWEQKSITIAGDTSGTWLTTNGVGINVHWGLGVGSTLSGTSGSWAGANYLSATGAVSLTQTNGATFYITGVQLEKGTAATSFDFRSYGTELALCQRYFEKSIADGTAANATTNPAPTLVGSAYSSASVRTQVFYKVPKRVTGTITRIPSSTIGSGSQWGWYNGGWNAGATSVAQSNANSFSVDITVSGLSLYNSTIIDGNWYTDAEL